MTAVTAPFCVNGARLLWRGDGGTVLIEPWGRDSVRVRARLMHDVADHDGALLPADPVDATIEVDAERATQTNRLRRRGRTRGGRGPARRRR